MMRISAKQFTLVTLVSVLSGCGGGGADNNTPPGSTHGWAGVSGSTTVDQPGTYGTRGIAAPANVPGARGRAVSWIDSSGKLWLFGGNGTDSAGSGGWLNDLWKYDPTTLEWTWVSGSNTVNQLGTYGTKGLAAPANVPGARGGAISWIDSSGCLWLFGGVGYDLTAYYPSIVFMDLWKYDPATLEWTWASGSRSTNRAGIYGTKDTAALSNIPGARDSAVAWRDSSGNLWLFGGFGLDSAGSAGGLNDLWHFR